MDRREFLTLTSKLAASAAIPATLYGCGGGSSSSVESLSSVDARVVDINTQQATIDSTNGSLNTALTNDLIGSNSASSSSLIRATNVAGTISDFFATRTPSLYFTTGGNNVFNDGHYLDSSATLSGTEFWQKAIDSHDQAFLDYKQQTEKLKAALRIFDAKNVSGTQSNVSTASVRSVSSANTRAESSGLADVLDQIIGYIGTNLINALLSTSTVTTIVNALIAINNYLVSNAFTQSVLSEVFTALSGLLDGIKEDSLNGLSFANKNQILLSLSKISVASAAVLANKRISELETTQNEDEFVESQLFSTDVLNKLSLKWLALGQSLVNSTVQTTTGKIDEAVAMGEYTGEGDNMVADEEASNSLFQTSAILSMTSLAMKTVFGNVSGQLDEEVVTNTGFETSSAADLYRPIFTSTRNSYDQELQANAVSLSSATEAGYQQELNISSVSTASILPDAEMPQSTDENAETIYSYAAEIASVGTEVTDLSDLNFAELLATYAYNFASDTESDAFEFAMQGMEYGYLFASQGEDVGIMADRILWMAVQIGVMADRIGEMADRIVYMSQLIVYTEILIVDFGILIYGVIKQISNSMLMALALILDREWYGDVATEQASSEDVILTTIGANVTQMLTNMNEYSLAVLDNQSVLRESTQSAIDTINFASSVEA
ncbi:MAG: hypothetical protein JXK16_00320 [Thiotrichales bacterium]|nr:hypothetical protein [Thiotrichales bacterium]